MNGAPIEDLKRGSVLCAPDSVKTGTTLKLHFEKSPFYYDNVRESAFHATVGMQTVPITMTEKSETTIAIESEKSIAYTPDDTFLLIDLNAKKMRIIGKARALQN